MRLTALLLLAACCRSGAQQVADSAFAYPIRQPAYAPGKGPIVTLDEAHANFHTLGGRYYPFGRLLEQDGYVMRPGRERFSGATLSGTRILVIANALTDSTAWALPARPAFTASEVEAVAAWVREGGSLLLIADHMPFPGAAAPLAAAFGCNFINGFALRTDQQPEVFSRQAGNLSDNPVTRGSHPWEHIDSIVVFTGQGFIAPPTATVITRLDAGYNVLLPRRAWVFNDTTPVLSGMGMVNGISLTFGKGRVVVFGEAAMFSAQLAGPRRQPTGMNHPRARQNAQFLLNIVHWLDGLL